MAGIATLSDIVGSELSKSGKDEFFNNGEFVLYDDNFQFIKKMMKYDDDVHKIVTTVLFQEYTFPTDESDKLIKKLFMNRFLDRSINRQTVEAFSTQLVYTCIVNEPYIHEVVTNLDRYIRAEKVNQNTGQSQDTSDSRSLFSSLPQNNVNLNVENTVLDYGDTNDISRNKANRTNESNATSSEYNLENLIKTNGLLEAFFVKIDENCFMQTW